MPRGDGTGPLGMGPGTGRGAGYCAGFSRPGCVNGGVGPGRGRGFGRFYDRPGVPGWGRCRMYPYEYTDYAQARGISAEEERMALKNQADFLEKQLNQVRERLDSLGEDQEKS